MLEEYNSSDIVNILLSLMPQVYHRREGVKAREQEKKELEDLFR